MKKSLIACVFTFASLSAATAAEFRDGWASTTYLRVHYADINLSHPFGAEVMLQRIEFAARRVCGGLPDIREIKERFYFKACVAEATEQAVEELGIPLVSSLHFGARAERFAAREPRLQR